MLGTALLAEYECPDVSSQKNGVFKYDIWGSFDADAIRPGHQSMCPPHNRENFSCPIPNQSKISSGLVDFSRRFLNDSLNDSLNEKATQKRANYPAAGAQRHAASARSGFARYLARIPQPAFQKHFNTAANVYANICLITFIDSTPVNRWSRP